MTAGNQTGKRKNDSANDASSIQAFKSLFGFGFCFQSCFVIRITILITWILFFTSIFFLFSTVICLFTHWRSETEWGFDSPSAAFIEPSTHWFFPSARQPVHRASCVSVESRRPTGSKLIVTALCGLWVYAFMLVNRQVFRKMKASGNVLTTRHPATKKKSYKYCTITCPHISKFQISSDYKL